MSDNTYRVIERRWEDQGWVPHDMSRTTYHFEVILMTPWGQEVRRREVVGPWRSGQSDSESRRDSMAKDGFRQALEWIENDQKKNAYLSESRFGLKSMNDDWIGF